MQWAAMVKMSFLKYEVNVASAKRAHWLPEEMDVHQFDFIVRFKNLLRIDDVPDPKQIEIVDTSNLSRHLRAEDSSL